MPIYTSSPGDSSIGMNIAYHELMNGSTLMIDPNKDVNEVCAIILAGKQNGCVILGGGSPKNFYLQAQPTLWEVYGIPKGGNDYFIQITTDQVVWGGLSRRDAGRSGELGQGESRRAARHGRRVLRLDDRVSAVLRVRRRIASTTAARARSSCTSATRSSPTCGVRRSGCARDEADREANPLKSIVIGDGNALVRAGVRSSSSVVAAAARSTPTPTCRPASSRYMREQLQLGRAVRARARRPAPRAATSKHYRLAQQLGRTLVTLDRDYLDDRRFPPDEGAGVMVLPAPDERWLRRLLRQMDETMFRPEGAIASAARRRKVRWDIGDAGQQPGDDAP